MKVLKDFPKKQLMKIAVTCLDDLWVLSKVIEVGDIVSGNTQRKIKIGDAAVDRNVKMTKKWMNLAITVEKIEYEPSLKVLRVSGPILEGNEDVAKGDYHSFTVEEQSEITIEKSQWFSYQRERLLKAQTATQSSTLLVCCDRERALFGWVGAQGFSLLASLRGNVQKKYEGATGDESFFYDLFKQITEFKPKLVVVGCTSFWQKNILSVWDELSKPAKLHFVENEDVSLAGVQRVLASKDFAKLLKDNVYAKQGEIFAKILDSVGELGVYGIEELTKASENGAVEELLITNKHMQKRKEKDAFSEIENLFSLIDASKGNIHIVDEESPIADQVEGLGGVVGFLRFKVD